MKDDEKSNSKNKLTSLEKLKNQQEKINARIKLMEARNKSSERKKETRRKILLGSYYWDEAKKNNQLESIKKLMSNYLTRESDRALFDLTELKPLEEIEA